MSETRPQCTPTRRFHRLAASCVYSAGLRCFTFKTQKSQQKFSWQHWVKSSYSSCNWEFSDRCWCESFIFTFDHLWVRTVWDTETTLSSSGNVTTDSLRLLIPVCNQSELLWIDKRKWSRRVVVPQKVRSQFRYWSIFKWQRTPHHVIDPTAKFLRSSILLVALVSNPPASHWRAQQ